MENKKYTIGCNYGSIVKTIISVLTILVLVSVCAVAFVGCKINHEIPEGIYYATEGGISYRYSENGTNSEFFLKVKGNYVTRFISRLGIKMKIIIQDEKIYFLEGKKDDLIYHEVFYDENEKRITVDWN